MKIKVGFILFLFLFLFINQRGLAQLGDDPKTVSGKDVVLSTNGLIRPHGTNTAVKFGQMEITTGGAKVRGRQTINQADLEIDDASYGLILINTNSQKWLVSVDVNGNLFTTLIASSPEIPQSERVTNLTAYRSARLDVQNLWGSNSTSITTTRLILLEKWLGLRSVTN